MIKSGVLENERGGEGDTVREETMEDGEGVKLLCLWKGVGEGN